MALLKNLKLTIRNLSRNKTVTSLNVLGLTVGLSISMLIFSFVMKEKSTDRFIPGVDNIYCLTNDGGTYLSQNMVNLVKDEIPEIDKITYCSNDWSPQIFLVDGQRAFKLNRMITADSCFFRVFQFKPVWGNPEIALNSTNKLVITRSLSEKIFGSENPVGKTLTYNATYLQGEKLEITAVIEDFPQESSWNFEAVLSFQTNYRIDWYVDNMKHWGTQNYKGFVRLNDHALRNQVTTKLSNISLDKVPDDMKADIKFGLFPFTNVYFDLPELNLLRHGNRLTVFIMGITGLLVLLLACVNYVNMVTAQREKRNKNIGIFKMMGSNRRRIIQLVTNESLVQVLTSAAISLLLTIVLLPAFNRLTSSGYSFSKFISLNYMLLLSAVLIVMVTITGIVPGAVFSKQAPSFLLKKQQGTKGINLSRNGLLVFQFAATIVLIASISVINKQSRYLNNQNLGFEKERIIYANTNDAIHKNTDALKAELKQIPGIKDFTFSENVLIKNDQNWGRAIINKGERYDIHFSKLSVAPNFFEFFGINIQEGKGFDENSNKNQDFIFNRTAKNNFNIENIEEAKMATTEPQKGQIIGVIDDYNFESLHVPIRAAGFMCSGDCDQVIYLKLNSTNTTSFDNTIKQIESTWNRLSPGFPLEYQFLDQKWDELYNKDRQFQKILSYTTIVSLLLSCLGLIGLTFFVMEQRTKEIGIRKVNGARISEILTMLNKDFIKWIAIAFVIATPIAYYAMNKWLENFAYKTELSWWIFVLAGLLALGIALLTVSWQSWKAATRNPVEALRYE
jgi:putative ABC transport system permease protein